MELICNKVQQVYENFMIKKSLCPVQNQKELKDQQKFYEVIQKKMKLALV